MCAFDAFQPSGTLNIQAFTGGRNTYQQGVIYSRLIQPVLGPVYASKHHFLDADPIYL
jgi:hypothetical protein